LTWETGGRNAAGWNDRARDRIEVGGARHRSGVGRRERRLGF
jgi:hypothetical protein